MATNKEKGTEQFKLKNYDKAVEFYTLAFEEAPTDHTILGNRSAAFHNMKEYDKALEDAEQCIAIKSNWAKGYQRKANALHAQMKLDLSMQAYVKAMELEPENAQIKNGLASVQQALMTQLEQMVKNNRKDLDEDEEEEKAERGRNGHLASDKEDLNGDDMGAATESDKLNLSEKKEMKMENQAEEESKKDDDQGAEKGDQPKSKEAAEGATPPEVQPNQEDKQKQAEALKAQGNDFYKKKDFKAALEKYQAAIDLNPDEITFHSNKAAVYFEMKDYDQCIEACNEGIATTKGKSYDYAKLAKAMARKANALLQKGQVDESIAVYESALLENKDHGIKMALQKAQKIKKDQEASAYEDPTKAEEHRLKGNELFKEGKFPEAIKEYDEGLKRNPKSVAIFSNRSATYQKLAEFTTALKDADKCLELDPKFVKAYARKGNCHHMMKEFHKALQAFEDGLKIDPSHKDCLEGKQKIQMAIQMNMSTSSENDEERARHAMADPEIQKILRDANIQKVLQELQENPQQAMGSMKDPYIAESINKLVAAGIVKMS